MPLCAVHIQAQHGHAQAIPQEQTPCVPRDRLVCITRFTQYLVYLLEPRRQEQMLARVVLPFARNRASFKLKHYPREMEVALRLALAAEF